MLVAIDSLSLSQQFLNYYITQELWYWLVNWCEKSTHGIKRYLFYFDTPFRLFDYTDLFVLIITGI